MDEPRQLFIHELGDVLYVERTLTRVLRKLAQEASNDELRTAFEKHRGETETHVANIEQVFELMDRKPRAHRCPGMDGIKAEHDDFVQKEKPSDAVLDMFLTGAAARSEHYEIAAYTGLITQAEALGERRAAQLMRENLAQEQAALEKVTLIGERLARAAPVMA